MSTITGDGNNNNLPGTAGNDSISSLDGNDTILANDGDDTLSGDTGSDSVDGGNGNDCLAGNEGRDSLLGSEGNDTLSGGDSDDTLIGNNGNDSFDGGDGNDSLESGLAGADNGLGSDTILGGAGDDTFFAILGSNSLDGGEGDDRFWEVSYNGDGVGTNGADTIIGGAGQDRFVLGAVLTSPLIPDTIADFQTGPGGDVVDIFDTLVFELSGYTNFENPFADGFFTLVQNGPDTLLKVDRDGAAHGANFKTVLVFKNTATTDFTGDNFTVNTVSGTIKFNPQSPVGQTVNGDENNNSLQSSADNDTILGNDGNDTFAGDLGGNDSVDGGAGNDSIASFNGSAAGNDTILGGSGADTIDDFIGANSLDGGSGNDYFPDISVNNNSFSLPIGPDTITGGLGRDVFATSSQTVWNKAQVPDTVTDFTAGAGGDLIDLTNLLSQGLNGWVAGTNPFSTGFIRVTQSGLDTLLQVDTDGPSGGGLFATLLILQNTTAASITSANFMASQNTAGGATGSLNSPYIPGNAFPNTIVGSESNDSIAGGGGSDSLFGLGGNDSLNAAGTLTDTLLLLGGEGNDYLLFLAGHASADGGDGDDSIFGGGAASGFGTVAGGAGDDTILGGYGADSISGDDGNDLIDDFRGPGTLVGGSGNDTFNHVSFNLDLPDTTFFTGSTGSDTYKVVTSLTDALVPDIITDFVVGSGGDVLDLTYLITSQLSGYNSPADPFATGFFRVVQNGVDTLLQADRDGSGNAASFQTILTLQNVTASTLAPDNILAEGLHYNPQFPAGVSIAGDNGDNSLTGGLYADTISGLGNDDTILGGLADDSLLGGAGCDWLNLGDGNDYADGGDEADTITGGSSTLDSDTIFGGNGGDQITPSAGNDSVDAGAGADSVSNSSGNDTILGGAGDDSFAEITGANVISADDGNDVFQNVSYNLSGAPTNGSDTLTGGDGMDTYRLVHSLAPALPSLPDTVTDFQASAAGDVIDLSDLVATRLSGFNNNSTTNPFVVGYFSLVQNGSEALLKADFDGPGSGSAPVTILSLTGVTASTLTADNILIKGLHYNPNGTAGQVISGDDLQNDSLAGGADDDTVFGLGGNDSITGFLGNDCVDGGAGNDNLGFNGNDTGNDTMLGGAGDDSFAANAGDDSLDGGDGNDTFVFTSLDGNDTATGGDGNDFFDSPNASDLLTGGAGIDTFRVAAGSTITDFAAGPGGDVVQLDALLNPILGSFGLYTYINPFAAGFLRFVQNGPDTLLQRDADGPNNPMDWVTVLTLSGVTAANLTSDNNLGRVDVPAHWNPWGDTGLVITGNDNADDTISGSDDADTISGLDGNDLLAGGFGNDSIDAGAGNDTFGPREDGLGNDTMLGGAGDDSIGENLDNDSFDGGPGNDTIDEWRGTNTLLGGDGNDVFDHVSYGFGTNLLTGGPGSDIFRIVFPNFFPRQAPDQITDFTPGAGGDVVDISDILANQLFGYVPGQNPFQTGFLQLVQSGNDVLLQIDRAGSATPGQFVTALTFQNTDISLFDAANVSPNFQPVAKSPIVQTISGYFQGSIVNDSLTGDATAGSSDTLFGLMGDDSLSGRAGNDCLDGAQDNDTLSGGDGNDTIVAGSGNDSILGGNNDDVITSGASTDISNDTVDGGAGNDTVTGSAGNDSLAGGSGNDSISGLAGADTIDGGDSNDTILGGGGNDVIHGGIGNDVITQSGLGNASLDGGGGLDTLTGGSDSDVIDGGGGADRLIGLAGDDTYHVDTGSDVIVEVGGGGIDTALTTLNYTLPNNVDNLTYTQADFISAGTGAFVGVGNTLDNFIAGGSGNNTLSGSSGNDTLTAGSSNDSLDGGTGSDSMSGGAGNDTYIVDNALDVISENLSDGAADLVRTALGAYTLAANVETLIYTGASAFHGTGNSANNAISSVGGSDTLDGSIGADTLTGGNGNDTYVVDDVGDSVVETGTGNDTVKTSINSYSLVGTTIENLTYTGGGDFAGIGNGSGNTISGGIGNDTIDGGTGIDKMTGGAGNDLYYVDNSADVLVEASGGGNDTVHSTVNYTLSSNVDTLIFGGIGNFSGAGSTQANTIIAGTGNDTLNGGSNADTLIGGDGNDVYFVDNSGDVITETSNPLSGIDTANATATKYTLAANVENLNYTGAGSFRGTGNAGDNMITSGIGNDTLDGSSGFDTVDAGNGNDKILGGLGNDQLLGNAGNDSLTGDAGADTVTGGAGADRFIFTSLSDLASGATLDIVADFSSAEADKLDVSGLDANTNLAGNQAFTFIGTASFSLQAGQLRYDVNGTDLIVSGDLNGDVMADFSFKVANVASLGAGDFVL